MRILVVDDEQPLRQMVRLALESAGYEVGEAEDGPRALEAWRTRGPWDAMLLDQRLPGMDGLEVLEKLHAADPGACVVMATAYASIDLAVEAMKRGARDFLRKPMTPDTLRGALAGALARRRAPQEAPRPAAVATVEAMTMNGFRIARAGSAGGTHAFRVRRFPADTEHDVVVTVAAHARERLERLARRSFPLEGAFWTLQAERALANHLWQKGALPESGHLEVSDVSHDDVDVASAWKSD